MEDFNIVLITMDAVRPDHLGPYGQTVISTPNLDEIGKEGVIFEDAAGASCLTPIAHGSILSGNHPPRHKVRGPFDAMTGPIISEGLKQKGYSTAGFVGVGFLGSAYGFARGFDYFSEPNELTAWGSKDYDKDNRTYACLFGNPWSEAMLHWLDNHKSNPFFIFGHYFECHRGAEKHMLETGLLTNNYLAEFDYYDAKIEYMDKILFGPLISRLKDYGLWEKTIIVATADHGENLGEHQVPPPFYPQHRTLYECDLKIPLIIKAPTLPKSKRIRGLVSSIDIVPTLLEILAINDNPTDGDSLVNAAISGICENRTAYAEELYEKRGQGNFQAVKSDRYKYIINRRDGREEFFDLTKDPLEKINLIGNLSKRQNALKTEWRNVCDSFLSSYRK